MSNSYQPPSRKHIEAFTASIVVFLVGLARIIFSPDAWLTHRPLHRAVKRAERAVECLLFLMAARLVVIPRKRDVSIIRRNAPSGFRRRCKRSKLFFKHARARLRVGGCYQRIARLITVLAKPARYVRRFLKLLQKGLRGSRLLAVDPPAHALSADAPQPLAFANSS